MTSETAAHEAHSLRLSEIFGPTVQGEGALIGQPTVFVRTGGCGYRCRWCDTPFAVLPEYRDQWQAWEPEAVLDEVDRLAGAPVLVTLSGGDPALQELGPLIRPGHERGHTFALETQASVSQSWFADLDHLTLSPKGPSSGHLTSLGEIEACLDASGAEPRTVFKVVIMNDPDFDYAAELAANYRDYPFYLQVGNPVPEGEPEPDELMRRYRWLVERCLSERWYAPTILPQLHVLAWGNARGV
ncbi:7-carboxy-7-deazaguanine synthase QueE [Thiohalorhabdus sp.]|uniref:7-carboxy-7-deazaguanine synthase QueE n=1 Tax=Thiohalorhabdus sp. TaxID=3094134 RepID=UPI002FC28449